MRGYRRSSPAIAEPSAVWMLSSVVGLRSGTFTDIAARTKANTFRGESLQLWNSWMECGSEFRRLCDLPFSHISEGYSAVSLASCVGVLKRRSCGVGQQLSGPPLLFQSTV